MIKIVLSTLFAACFLASFSLTAQAAQDGRTCYFGNTVSELLHGDTYIGNYPIGRDASGSFQTTEPSMREIAAYLSTLQLPSAITRAHIVLRKSLIRYEPFHTLHHGKPWYDGSGNLVNSSGDENLLQNWNKDTYRAVRIKMLDFEEEHMWGPYVLYENEEKGKGVVDAEIVLLDKNDCYLSNLEMSFYRLPKEGSPINLDNIDGGNEYWEVALFSDGVDPYVRLDGGTAPLYPERKKDLRFEWDKINGQKFTSGHANNTSAHHSVLADEKKIVYNTTVVYPHLKGPRVSVINDDKKGGYHLVVELPKYFQGRFIPAFVGITFSGNTATVHMVRGTQQQTFTVPITDNPLPTSVDWDKN
ncbi:MAG: hypothetical protein HYY55_03395 [Candidatus Niyogibacteria bacterium]|nr:MAG: hypothetical protein HYY55_03395 [Candidatus Niyogibacteria bacterium]